MGRSVIPVRLVASMLRSDISRVPMQGRAFAVRNRKGMKLAETGNEHSAPIVVATLRVTGKRLALCLMTVLLLPVQAFAEGAPQTLSLSQCVDEALAKGDAIGILDSNLAIKRAHHAQTIAANSPTLGGSAGYRSAIGFGDDSLQASNYGTTGVAASSTFPQALQAALALSGPMTNTTLGYSESLQPLGTPTNAGIIALSASQTLWDGYPGGTWKATVEKSRLSLQSTELAADADKAALVYTVKQAYFTMLASQRNLAVDEEILAQQEAYLKQITTAYDMQQASSIDLQLAQINVKSADIDLRAEQSTRREALLALANLMGWPRSTEFSVAETEDPPQLTLTLEEALATALDSRISTSIDLALITGQTQPTISVNGGAYMMFSAPAGTNAQSLSAGVSISMPLLDAGGAARKMDENRAQKEMDDRQESQQRRAIALEIETAYNDVIIQRERLELARLKAENDTAQYQLEKTGNQYGTVTNRDVMSASVDVANAQMAWARAKSDVLVATLKLQKAMGY